MAAPFRAIGIVGMGFVGRAVAQHLARFYEVWTYDSRDGEADSIVRQNLRSDGSFLPARRYFVWAGGQFSTWAAELTKVVDGPIFICVPTPPANDGRCDTSIVEQVLAELGEHSGPDYHNVAVIKSTVPPGTTDRLVLISARAGAKFAIVHNPEFLTERTAAWDFAHQQEIIIGGPEVARGVVHDCYYHAFPHAVILPCTALEAELVKYMRNCFYAVKLSFANEIAALCRELEVDYQHVRGLNAIHPWLGAMHWDVPGPDGQLGWGGKCFPKDLAALIHLCRERGVNCDTMVGAFASNASRREDPDRPSVLGPYRSPC